MRHPETAHWRDSARIPKFFILDGFSAIPLVLFLLHIRMWSFLLACTICLFFVVLNHFGFTLPIFLRFFRAFIAGNVRLARSWMATRKNRW